MLETTGRTVASIAADVGYRDAGAFSGIFARHTGRRPREYCAIFHRRGDRGEAETRCRET
ncbi:helix-turn-helix domain-containing protein [Streptomyces platensis]|uniref:helix-turn-helix domain-containing protein n=1 Tax=Streptomyces platensis TaxID=58346 RepID=UPI00386F80C6